MSISGYLFGVGPKGGTIIEAPPIILSVNVKSKKITIIVNIPCP